MANESYILNYHNTFNIVWTIIKDEAKCKSKSCEIIVIYDKFNNVDEKNRYNDSFNSVGLYKYFSSQSRRRKSRASETFTPKEITQSNIFSVFPS